MSKVVLVFKKGGHSDLLKVGKMAINFFGASQFVNFPVGLSKKTWNFFTLPFVFVRLFLKSFKINFLVSLEDSYLGFLVVTIAFFNGKKSMVIIENDTLWLNFVSSRTKFFMPMKEFYRILPSLKFWDKITLYLNRYMCNYSDYLVFYEKETAEIWENFYGFSKEKALIINGTKSNESSKISDKINKSLRLKTTQVSKKSKLKVLAKKSF